MTSKSPLGVGPDRPSRTSTLRTRQPGTRRYSPALDASDSPVQTEPHRHTGPEHFDPAHIDTPRTHVPYQALDEQTFDRMIRALDRAHTGGLHPVEVLHRAGLVLSPDAERAIKVSTLEYVLEELRAWSPAEFLRRRDKRAAGATPAELHRCICEYIEDLISVARKDTHGPVAG